MAFIPRPTPCFLDQQDYLGYVQGEQRWRRKDGKRLYTWDGLHGEIEAFNRRGDHVGVLDAVNGTRIKPAREGRRIDV